MKKVSKHTMRQFKLILKETMTAFIRMQHDIPHLSNEYGHIPRMRALISVMKEAEHKTKKLLVELHCIVETESCSKEMFASIRKSQVEIRTMLEAVQEENVREENRGVHK